MTTNEQGSSTDEPRSRSLGAQTGPPEDAGSNPVPVLPHTVERGWVLRTERNHAYHVDDELGRKAIWQIAVAWLKIDDTRLVTLAPARIVEEE